ncbi:MAG: hypothetical protein HY271_19920 [Deltaproteobacteria bacterium]|nr:hypothetical protein [Deltaproteobacteria bacterium]
MVTMTKRMFGVRLVLVVTLLVSATAWADESAKKQHTELAKAMTGAKVSLATALTASASEGKPISAKFEVEDGKLQLSVYTEKNGQFKEVIVDHQTGKVTKAEAITEGEDLAAAKSQSATLARAKRSLSAAVAKAVAKNPGYHAVSATPTLKGGAVVKVTLVKGDTWKTVTQKLD